LIVNQLVVLFTGMAGRYGLAGLTSGRLTNRFFTGGHSLYFLDCSGSERDDFMQQYWVPVLTTEGIPERMDQRKPPSVWGGLLQTVIQNAEPIKMALYAALFLTPSLVFYHLYREANHQRVIAEQQTALAKAEKVAAEEQRTLADLERTKAIKERLKSLRAIELMVDTELNTPSNASHAGATDFNAIATVGRFVAEMIHFEEADQPTLKVKIELASAGAFCVDESGEHPAPDDSNTCHESREYGIGLDERLAQAFRRALMLQGIEESALTTVAFGAENPQTDGRFCYPPKFINAGVQNKIARLNTTLNISFYRDEAMSKIEEGSSERSEPAPPHKCIPYSARLNSK
jgi:hypothetical protein